MKWIIILVILVFCLWMILGRKDNMRIDGDTPPTDRADDSSGSADD